MRLANILSGIAVALWFGLLLVGRGLVFGVVHQHVLGYPNTGQIDFLVVWPAGIVSVLLLLAWLVNGLRRWSSLLALVAGTVLVALLPYLFVYGGGV